MNINVILPIDKGDVDKALSLKNYAFVQLKPYSMKLLSYLQDMNWPVAAPVANCLRTYVNDLVDEIVEILRSDDDMWKYWIIVALIDKVNYEINPIIIDELNRLANFPSSIEKDSEVDIVAIETLNNLQMKRY